MEPDGSRALGRGPFDPPAGEARGRWHGSRERLMDVVDAGLAAIGVDPAMIEVEEDVFVSRHDYLWDFYKARKDAGNEPFLMKSPKDAKWFLWIFSDNKLSYELLDLYMAASSVKLQQVNVKNVPADNADGSFDEE